MNRFVSYPIVRAAASIAVYIILLGAHANALAADDNTGGVVGFEDGQGKTLFLHDFRGKPVIINLWATWCEPCVAEMPSLAQLQQDYAAKGLTVIALSEDESLDKPLAFYKKMNISALAPYLDRGHAVWLALMAHGVPTTVLVTREGQMVQRIEGPVDWQSAQVRSLVGEITGK
jgi:thiol-disulfide isomerase/thioredoxin